MAVANTGMANSQRTIPNVRRNSMIKKMAVWRRIAMAAACAEILTDAELVDDLNGFANVFFSFDFGPLRCKMSAPGTLSAGHLAVGIFNR